MKHVSTSNLYCKSEAIASKLTSENLTFCIQIRRLFVHLFILNTLSTISNEKTFFSTFSRNFEANAPEFLENLGRIVSPLLYE